MTTQNETYRRVTMALGGWQWGYPRGHRIGIVRYRAEKLKNGRVVWRSVERVCDGLTAASVDYFERRFPTAFAEPIGSIHNKAVEED